MQSLPDFRLEVFFSQWEFNARYNLAASDCETLSLSELLGLAADAEREQWDALRLGYTETFGSPSLREAIAQTYDRVQADDIVCFAGAEEGIFLGMQVLLSAGDHAIVIAPNYQAAESVPLAIGDVSAVALEEKTQWSLDVDAIERAIRPNTKLISVNFPNNPTGAVVPHDVWERLVRLCDARGIRLFSDEVYRGLEADASSALIQAADASATAISLNVMSKAYGLPGLRIGWIACRDRDVIRRLERAKHYTTICNAAPSELLATIALKARATILERNRDIVAQNARQLSEFFSRHSASFDFEPPQGGCVAFPAFLGGDVEAMCERLVTERGILLLPASMFASQLASVPRNRFRIGLGRDPARVAEALDVWDAGV